MVLSDEDRKARNRAYTKKWYINNPTWYCGVCDRKYHSKKIDPNASVKHIK